LYFALPKGKKTRTVDTPSSVAEELKRHVEAFVPTAGGGASVGKPEVRGRKFSPLFTTRLGNAVAVNTGNTYTWKPAPAEAALIPPRAEERIPGRGRRPRRTASTCCGTPMPRSCWRPESPS
jgi:hypothetical protein